MRRVSSLRIFFSAAASATGASPVKHTSSACRTIMPQHCCCFMQVILSTPLGLTWLMDVLNEQEVRLPSCHSCCVLFPCQSLMIF